MASNNPNILVRETRDMFGPEPPRLRLTEKPNRGCAMITTETIESGDRVFQESPLFMYPSTFASLPFICSHCFQAPSSQQFPCTICKVARFCSNSCRLHSLHSHPFLVCSTLPYIISLNCRYPDDLIYLLYCYSLPFQSFNKLSYLHRISSLPKEYIDILDTELTILFTRTNDISLLRSNKVITSNLMFTKNNSSFQLPLTGEDDVRAYGLYLWVSIINHDCVPNACLVEYKNDIALVSSHKIEKGREICTSYFVGSSAGYEERQRILLEHYGFKCKCVKCESESKSLHNLGVEIEEDTGDNQEEMGTEDRSGVEEVKVGEEEQKDTGDDQEEIGTDVNSGGEEVKVGEEEQKDTREDQEEMGTDVNSGVEEVKVGEEEQKDAVDDQEEIGTDVNSGGE